MSRLTRRQLMKGALGAGGAITAAACSKSFGQIIGANDDIRVAVIGLHGRGNPHSMTLQAVKGFRLVALCDVDPKVLGQAGEKYGKDLKAFADVRKLLERKDIDAVTVATPSHWHSLISIWACQAGKDVYVEKPLSHNVWEGRQLLQAARKHDRIVQHGTQARANPDIIEAREWIRAGQLGKPRYVYGMCHKPRLSIGNEGKGKIPAGLDYDLWTGPAPMKPLARKKLHYDWNWVYDNGVGDIGNQAIHEVDLARWFLGYEGIAPRVISIGGRLGYDDDGETPNTQLIYFDYDGPSIVFEVRGLPKSARYHAPDTAWRDNMDVPPGFNGPWGIGMTLVCEGGRLIIEEGNTDYPTPGGYVVTAADPQGKTIRRFAQFEQPGISWQKGDAYAFGSWQKAIRSRKSDDLTADVLEGHISSTMCHAAMISHRIGKTRPSGEILEEIKGNAMIASHFESVKDHLERNGVDVASPKITLGPWLTMDVAAERFVDNAAANALLSRPYRKPYVVPESV